MSVANNNNNEINLSATTSLSERYRKAVSMVESDPIQAVEQLTKMQYEISQLALFSKDNMYDMNDIITSSLPYLLLEHYLALSYTRLPTTIDEIHIRQKNLNIACTLWNAFIQNLHTLEQLNKQEEKLYNELIEILDHMNSNNDNNNSTQQQQQQLPVLAISSSNDRDVKIARFRIKQQLENERKRLESLQLRRKRLNIASDEEMDEYDEEGLLRTITLNEIQIAKSDAFDELSSTIRELPMISMMVKSQKDQQSINQYKGRTTTTSESNDQRIQKSKQEHQNKPLKLTHITQSVNGQLQLKHEEIRSNVFKPGWNQPTMSLQELAEKEIYDAKQRDLKQKQTEELSKNQPRRYEFLQKDGLEDNTELVDSSIILDRKWDDFKDNNKRGSGNKRGDVGDRNF